MKRQRVQTETWIADIQKQLAGVIQCPKCRHEFTLVNNIDIEASRLQLQDYEREVEAISLAINKNQESVSSNDERIRSTRAERGVLDASKADRSVKITESQTHLNKMVRDASVLSSDTQALQDKINAIQKSLDTCRLDLFDDAYGVLDGAIKTKESAIQQANDDISNAEGAILSYEESLKEVEAISDTELLDSLKSSKQKYEKELAQAIVQQEDVHKELNELKTQEATFIEFKTHLANTKIDALSHITNEFLEAIGSDIRISFSGYTVLKSGKIRDKISISLIRDGVDCGSFGKFSEGEKARVNLANILAMHKLTNVNCLEGKGLDLLILDEILDATDETGLANIFEALNSLQITSLAVSHGHVAENYPHQLVVNKKNGISFII